MNASERRLLEAACVQTELKPSLIERLIAIEQESQRKIRRRGIFQTLRAEIEGYLESEPPDDHKET